MRRIATLQIGGETMHRRLFLAGLAASAACVRARAAAPSTEERLTLATSRLAEIEAREGGRLGVFVRDTGAGATIEHRADERFPMCSTFKLLTAAAALNRVDEGADRLDRKIAYGPSDLLEDAPIAKAHVAEGGMTVADLCAAAIDWSDNTAANLVLQTIGGPAGFTAFARSIGDQVTRLDRNVPALNDWSVGDDRDTTSPATICEDLRRLLLTDVLSQESRDRLNHWLESSQTSAALIRASVPPGWSVGDKSGRLRAGATNDVAVIYPPDGAPIFVAIYILNASTSDEQRSATLSTVARFVCEAFRPDPTK